MSKFWQKKYTSKYTGAEIDAAVGRADTVPAVTAADAGKALVVDAEGKIVAGEAGGIENGYVIINITNVTQGAINSVKFNDVEKGANWLKDPKTAVILSISLVSIIIGNTQYSTDANWVNTGTLLSGTGAYTENTPDGLEFGLCDINFVFADDEINADFVSLFNA